MQQGPPPQQPPSWTGPPPGTPPWAWPGGARRGMRWRASVTILLGTAWLVFILLFAAFWAGPPLNLFQDLVVFFASLIVLFGCIAALWAAWGMRWAGMGSDHWR